MLMNFQYLVIFTLNQHSEYIIFHHFSIFMLDKKLYILVLTSICLLNSCYINWPVRTVGAIYMVDSNYNIKKIKRLTKYETINLNRDRGNLKQESNCQIKYHYEFNLRDTFQRNDSIQLVKTCLTIYNHFFSNKRNYKSPNIFMKFEVTDKYSYWGEGNFHVSVNREAGFVFIKEKKILIYTDVRCPFQY